MKMKGNIYEDATLEELGGKKYIRFFLHAESPELIKKEFEFVRIYTCSYWNVRFLNRLKNQTRVMLVGHFAVNAGGNFGFKSNGALCFMAVQIHVLKIKQ
jgi:hypothetical protein